MTHSASGLALIAQTPIKGPQELQLVPHGAVPNAVLRCKHRWHLPGLDWTSYMLAGQIEGEQQAL